MTPTRGGGILIMLVQLKEEVTLLSEEGLSQPIRLESRVEAAPNLNKIGIIDSLEGTRISMAVLTFSNFLRGLSSSSRAISRGKTELRISSGSGILKDLSAPSGSRSYCGLNCFVISVFSPVWAATAETMMVQKASALRLED
jgi:hypothetical protein